MMSTATPGPVTQLLVEWGQGSEEALQRLMPLVYDELRGLARRYLRREPSKESLESAGLVHEEVPPKHQGTIREALPARLGRECFLPYGSQLLEHGGLVRHLRCPTPGAIHAELQRVALRMGANPRHRTGDA